MEDRRVAIVTGAGRGIGAAVAKRLAQAGTAVGVLDVDQDSAASIAAEVERQGGAAVAVQCDVSQSQQVDAAVDTVQEAFGPVSLLVNNAGVGGPFHRVDEVSDAEWDWIISTNLKSVFLFCRRLLPIMRQREFGRIVNIASIQGFLGAATSSTYVASKHGVIGYTRAIAAEWGQYGITCNAICPGYVDTRMGVQDEQVSEHQARVLRRTPVGRIATPNEIASMAEHLLRADSGYINGACIVMDGGISADVGI